MENLGQKSNGHLIKALLYGLATGEVKKVNPNRWYPLAGHQTDSGIILAGY